MNDTDAVQGDAGREMDDNLQSSEEIMSGRHAKFPYGKWASEEELAQLEADGALPQSWTGYRAGAPIPSDVLAVAVQGEEPPVLRFGVDVLVARRPGARWPVIVWSALGWERPDFVAYPEGWTPEGRDGTMKGAPTAWAGGEAPVEIGSVTEWVGGPPFTVEEVARLRAQELRESGSVFATTRGLGASIPFGGAGGTNAYGPLPGYASFAGHPFVTGAPNVVWEGCEMYGPNPGETP